MDIKRRLKRIRKHSNVREDLFTKQSILDITEQFFQEHEQHILNIKQGKAGKDGYTPKKGVDYFDGKDGYTPQKGADYFTPKEIKQFKKEVTPVKGKDYFDGKDGKDGKNGIDGVDGTTTIIHKEEDLEPKEIRDRLEKLKGSERLDAKAIKNLDKYLGKSKVIYQMMGGGSSEGGGGVSDHGALTGLADDDHPQYYNESRLITWLGSRTTTELAEGTNLYFTNERVDDRVEALMQDGTGIGWTYDDTAGTLTPAVTLAPFSTTDLSEGTNLYYTSARFDTAFSNKSTTDLAEGDNLYYTNDRTDARIALQKGAANGIATLGADSKIPTSQLPPLALTDTYVVADEAAQLALSAEEGDVAVRTDQNKSYIHNGGTAGTMADWQELLTPTDVVLSVNGQTGAVNLTTTEISEGTNLYYTQARFDSAFGAKSTSNLAEGTNLYFTDARARGALSGTTNQVNYSSTTGVFSLPQDIHTAATPTFGSITTTNATVNGTLLFTQAIKQIDIDVGSDTNINFDWNFPGLTTQDANIRFFRSTASSGGKRFYFYKGDGTATLQHLWTTTGNSFMCNDTGNLGIGTNSPSDKLHVFGNSSNTGVRVGYDTAEYGRIQRTSTTLDIDTISASASQMRFGRISSSGATYRFFRAGTSTVDLMLDANGGVYIGDTSNIRLTQGLTINQGTADDEILALKSSDIAHGMTSRAEADTFGAFSKFSPTWGGVMLRGWSAINSGILLSGETATDSTAKTSSASAKVLIRGFTQSGTSVVAPGANTNILGVQTGTDLVYLVDAEGDTWQSGTQTLAEQSTTPSNPTAGTEARIYIKSDKLVVQFNDAGTVRYKYLDLTGTGANWVHDTVAP